MSRVEEKTFLVEGLTLAARHWGDPAAPPVLALHGWLDNAASFDALAAELVGDVQILALDLPGHGLSDHKPASGNYAIWDDLRSVLAVAGHLGWQQFGLIGHSRGAMMTALLAAAVPERVNFAVFLDGLIAEPVAERAMPTQLGRYLRDYGGAPSRPRAYRSIAEAAAARRQRMPMSPAAAEAIATRGCYRAGDGLWHWRSDRRLTMASPLKLTAPQWRAVVEGINAPARLFLPDAGLMKSPWQTVKGWNTGIDTVSITGDHHCHMGGEAKTIAADIRQWLAPSPDISG